MQRRTEHHHENDSPRRHNDRVDPPPKAYCGSVAATRNSVKAADTNSAATAVKSVDTSSKVEELSSSRWQSLHQQQVGEAEERDDEVDIEDLLQELREQIVITCTRLAGRGLIIAAEGNASVRIPGTNFILTTPAGVNKAFIKPSDLITVDLTGHVVEVISKRSQSASPLNAQGTSVDGHDHRARGKKPSSELPMHLAIYKAFPEVQAIVHAHPPYAVSLTLAHVDMDAVYLPETVTTLGGGIPTAPYATPSTPELAQSVVSAFVSASQGRDDDTGASTSSYPVIGACLMEFHGAVAVGKSLSEACDRMETVERVCEVVHHAYTLKGTAPSPFPAAEVDKLMRRSKTKATTVPPG